MADRIPISYGEFYDFPRMIRFQFGGEWFFLDSPFNEERDDYPDVYNVYLLPFRSEEEIKAIPFYWKDLSHAVHLGQIGVTEIGLDETRRRSLDAGVIGPWLSARKGLPRGDGGSSAPSSLDCVETST
jgi:hypothetical protein